MKLKGIFGKGSGKLGNAVFAVSGGEQLVKEYNPRVSNPNTPAQVEQRAKFKLLSQLAAVFAPAMAFKKTGLVSARNMFIAKNIPNANYQDSRADIALPDITLTGSVVSFPQLEVGTIAGGSVPLQLHESASGDVRGVVYVLVDPDANGLASVKSVKLITEGGNDNKFPTTFSAARGQYFAYGYGIKDNGLSEVIKFNNLGISQEDEEASLSINEIVKAAGSSFTRTQYAGIEVD